MDTSRSPICRCAWEYYPVGGRSPGQPLWKGICPSAPLSRCRQSHAVLLPESFRGGCSFGAGTKAGLSRRGRTIQMGTDHRPAKPVNAHLAAFNGIANGIARLRQLTDLLAQFLDSAAGLV